MSRRSAVWRWAKWEFDREIEVTPVIRFITVERFIKGALLLLGGVALLVTGGGSAIRDWALNLQADINLQAGSSWWASLLNRVLVKLVNLKASTATLIASGAIAYGLLEIAEGVGLLMRKRWAEYVVVIATAAFIPIELDELVRRPRLFKVGATVLNVAIVVYLVWRKRVFIERPSEEPPDGSPARVDG